MSNSNPRKKYVYILRLENNKWYIGSSSNLEERLHQHCTGQGSSWTATYQPLELFDCVLQRDGWHEENLTKEYMIRYGIENVRGGPYTSCTFTEEEKEAIQRCLDSYEQRCYICGSSSHFAYGCRLNSINGSEEDIGISSADDICSRCGREGHYCSECYATTHKNGQSLGSPSRHQTRYNYSTNNSICSRCGREGHYVQSVMRQPTKMDKAWVPLQDIRQGITTRQIIVFVQDVKRTLPFRVLCDNPQKWTKLGFPFKHQTRYNYSTNNSICSRCGREGHYRSECYATTHKNGQSLGSPSNIRQGIVLNDIERDYYIDCESECQENSSESTCTTMSDETNTDSDSDSYLSSHESSEDSYDN
eukprot:jgi/Galph1/6037/GphlegSOOS_G4684.1